MSAIPVASAPELFPAGFAVDQLVADPEEMKAMAAFWRIEQLQLDPGLYRGRLRIFHTPRVQLGLTWRSHSSRISGEVPPGTLVFALRLPATGPTYFRGEILGPQEIPYVQAGKEFTFQPMGASNVISVAVKTAAIEAYTGTAWADFSPGGWREGRLALRPGTSTGEIAKKLSALLELSLRHPTLLIDPVMAGRFERQVVGLLLGSTVGPAPVRPAPPRRQIGLAAEEFLRAHADHPLAMHELSAALRTPPRTLELGFHEVCGLSPKAYLQALRFNGARRDLRVGDPRATSVKAVALRWGFLHFGRFAVNYRRWFGESPAETLHR